MKRCGGSREAYVLFQHRTGTVPGRRVSRGSWRGMYVRRKSYYRNNIDRRRIWQIPARRDAGERSCFSRQQFSHRPENIVPSHCMLGSGMPRCGIRCRSSAGSCRHLPCHCAARADQVHQRKKEHRARHRRVCLWSRFVGNIIIMLFHTFYWILCSYSPILAVLFEVFIFFRTKIEPRTKTTITP